MKNEDDPAAAGGADVRPRDPAREPIVGDVWAKGKAALTVTKIADDRVTLTPSGAEIAQAPTTWTLAVFPASVPSFPGWAYVGGAS